MLDNSETLQQTFSVSSLITVEDQNPRNTAKTTLILRFHIGYTSKWMFLLPQSGETKGKGWLIWVFLSSSFSLSLPFNLCPRSRIPRFDASGRICTDFIRGSSLAGRQIARVTSPWNHSIFHGSSPPSFSLRDAFEQGERSNNSRVIDAPLSFFFFIFFSSRDEIVGNFILLYLL